MRDNRVAAAHTRPRALRGLRSRGFLHRLGLLRCLGLLHRLVSPRCLGLLRRPGLSAALLVTCAAALLPAVSGMRGPATVGVRAVSAAVKAVKDPAAVSVGGRAAQDPGGPGPAAPVAVARVWPVGVRPAVLRGWDPPTSPYGAGHRGVDLATAPGAPVRAVARGRVVFAGRVAGRGVVSVELAGTGRPPLRTTYEPVHAAVGEGEQVAPGQVVGVVEDASEAGGTHCAGGGCLHWGLLRGESYLDPLSVMPPWLLRRAPSRLLPVAGVPLPVGTEFSRVRPAAPS